MRAGAIRARDRVYDRCLAIDKALMYTSERRVQTEEAVEVEEAIRRSRSVQRELAAHVAIVRVGIRCCERQPIDGTAQDDEYEPRAGIRIGEREPGNVTGKCRQPDRPQQVSTIHHAHLLWKSGDARNSVMPCARLSARATALRVSGLKRAPSTASPSSTGSTREPMRLATVFDHSMRL